MGSISERPRVKSVVRVGIIGCGEIAQVAHIPTLSFLSELFQITYLCDVSDKTLEHCKAKINGASAPETTKDPRELCSSQNVDVVFVLTSDEYHADQAALALQHNKHVFVEKPLALNLRDIDRISEIEKTSKGKVMVGYMRRYATAFELAVKEIGGIDKVLYARVRDIIGPNSTFVSQSGTFPKRFDDFDPKDTADRAKRASELTHQGLKVESGVEPTESNKLAWRLLGGLGTHDISVMREALGMPSGVIGAHMGFPFWNVLFQYPGFVVSYESGIDSVPRFDAHVEIYGQDKTVRIQYDSPYVKGLPITLNISENSDGGLKETTLRPTYEDPYTLELKQLHSWVTDGKKFKTTVGDARKDTEIFQMIMKATERS